MVTLFFESSSGVFQADDALLPPGGSIIPRWQGTGFYTMIIYDKDARGKSPFVHYLVSNIPEDDISKGKVILDYVPPDPPPGERHQYHVQVYSQIGTLDIRKRTKRDRFPMQEFVRNYALMPLGYSSFYYETPQSAAEDLPSEEERKYCDCVIEVAKKQPTSCNYDRAWYQRRDGETCYNPYAVCAASTGASSTRCGEYYQYSKLSDEQLLGFASLRRIALPRPYDRTELLERIASWKNAEGK